MRFVDVVPVRRMPADRPWLTYALPEEMTIAIGWLVTIPLRGRPVLGVVWNIHDQAPSMKTQNISTIHLTSPIISDWQRGVCEIMARSGSTSLGDVLFRIVPKLTLRNLQKKISGTLPEQKAQTHQTSTLNWYRSRTEALDLIEKKLREVSEPIVIITPTNDDAEELVRLSEQQGRTAVHIHSQLAPTIYAEWYNRVRNGELLVVVGGVSALSMPFTRTPCIILDQEEHHAHKQTSQSPYYDHRVILNQLQVAITKTTPAPSIATWNNQQLTPPVFTSQRKMLSLHGPKVAPLLTQAVLDVIDEGIEHNKKILCISPRRGYASTTACRACGTALTCPTCGRTASVFRGLADEARCHSCQTSIPLRTTCQKCGSAEWVFQGYGIEQTASALQRLRPEITITPMVDPTIEFDVAVDTYQVYRAIRHINNLGAVVVMSGDSLLSSPDYSVAERAWQYLARLQAEAPTIPLYVQTFEPESLFWQRWLHGDDQAWYTDEVAQRQRLHVPPFVTQWIASWRGEKSEVHKKISELTTTYGQIITVRPLPEQKKSATRHRLLLQFKQPNDASTFPWTKLFPLPWHLDQYPTSWVD